MRGQKGKDEGTKGRRHEGESAIRNPQSPIPDRQSSIVNRQSAIPNPQSAIRNPWLAAGLVFWAGIYAGVGCDTASAPNFVQGAAVSGSEVPELSILRPNANVSISRDQGLQIEWLDADRDSNAVIRFFLVSVADPSATIALVDEIAENPDGIFDRLTVPIDIVPFGTYTLRGEIDDGENRPVATVATNRAAGLGEVIIQIVEEGTTSIVNRPPRVFVREPMFNLSVSQDDQVIIVVQPQEGEIAVDTVYDVDSTATLYLVLDLDDDPLNDDVVRPEPDKIILLREPTDITQGDSAEIRFPVVIDLEKIPLREDGRPYRIRATITDGLNEPVHSYAPGTLNVVRAATGFVDLGKVGRTISGAVFRGFNPGSRLGTRMVHIDDFDQDGIDDCILVAQFGNPRNFGNAGEAYLIYGQDNVRFGGEINVNSTARTIPGVIFEGPPTRCFSDDCMTVGGLVLLNTPPEPRTDGITDVSFIPDLDGDGRPELLFGVSHADGVYQSRDDDPDDNPPEGDETISVEINLRQGTQGLQIDIEGDPDPLLPYFGVVDMVISSAEPGTNFRSSDLEWVNRGPNDTQWVLIKFENVLQTFPPIDTPDRISDIGGSLVLNVLNGGGDATIHELFVDFDASMTFNSFLGRAPQAGVDYNEEEIENVNAGDVGDEIRINVDEFLIRLLINDLPGNELRFIIVPADVDDDDADDNVRVASSEFGDARQRPSLEIQYDREVRGGPFGCYPDPLPNNFTDEGNNNLGLNESKLEALGFVALVHSSNRDNAGLVNPDRLADTVVSLELVGQRPLGAVLNGQLIQEAENDEEGRIDGARFQTGWYDFFDHLLLGQPPLNALFGRNVSWIEDLDLDGAPEIVISSPRNQLDLEDIIRNFGFSTHFFGRLYRQGDIIVIPGGNYDDDFWRDKTGNDGTAIIPHPLDEAENGCARAGTCDPQRPVPRCGQRSRGGTFEIIAEDSTDFLGGARSAGDFNLDSVPDLLCGAPLNDFSSNLQDTGTVYIIYLRTPVGDVRLADADDPLTRPPMLRISGETAKDRIGWKQEPVMDVNGDRIDDVMFSSPATDFILPPPDCAALSAQVGLISSTFNSCRTDERADEVFLGDTCKAFDYNNDRRIDDDDREVFDCLAAGLGSASCCPVDNGYIGIIFGGVNVQGDRRISQLGTDELRGVVFYGTDPGDLAGFDISSAGDFDKDGFGDILITAPGERRIDANGRERMGVTYLVYGGPHLEDQEAPIELSEIGNRIPGIIFLSPYVSGAPDEAPTEHVGFLGDINDDGFGDIAIGVPRADLLDEEFPQGDGSPNETGRRPDQGDVYVIYGNNINR